MLRAGRRRRGCFEFKRNEHHGIVPAAGDDERGSGERAAQERAEQERDHHPRSHPDGKRRLYLYLYFLITLTVVAIILMTSCFLSIGCQSPGECVGRSAAGQRREAGGPDGDAVRERAGGSGVRGGGGRPDQHRPLAHHPAPDIIGESP